MLAYVSFSLLLLLAAAHSGLGEAGILRPLFASRWRIEGVPRGPAERILRFAWHLTSLAWVGLACAAIGAGALQVVAVVCGLSGLVILAMLRGHLAWPLFLVAGGAAWAADGSSPLWVWSLISWSAAALAFAVAGLHVYWGVGGSTGIDAVIPPRRDGSTDFRPPGWSCFAVAAACATLGVLVLAPSWTTIGWFGWSGLGCAGLLLTARAVGDGRSVGFSKGERSSRFAVLDDAIYTPLVVVLLFGVLSSLLIAAS